MRQARSALPAAVPVALLGCVAAHWAAYAIVHPDAHERALALAGTGHGYAGYLPLAALAAVALAALGAARHAATRTPGARPSPWLFATLPPAAFTVQEHVERLLHRGSFPLDAAVQTRPAGGARGQTEGACSARFPNPDRAGRRGRGGRPLRRPAAR